MALSEVSDAYVHLAHKLRSVNPVIDIADGYITPKTKLEGKEREIFELKEERLAAARLDRQIKNKIRQVA